jgi:hypothetical protein
VCCLAVIVIYVHCGHLCPVLLSVLSVISLEKKYGIGRSVLEIRNEIMSSQLEGLVQFPIWSLFSIRRYC